MNPIRRELEALGFERIDSGGGCTAMWKEADGMSFMLSDEANSVEFEPGCLIGISSYVGNTYRECADINPNNVTEEVTRFMGEQIRSHRSTIYTHKKQPGSRFALAPKQYPGHVCLYAEGGGYHMAVPIDKFEEEFEVAPSPQWRSGYFSIQDYWVLKGFTDGRRWNGWEMPLFEKEECDLIMKYTNCDEFTHRWVDGQLVLFSEDYPDGRVYPSIEIEINDKTHTVWPFGDGWCWDDEGRT